MLKKNNIDHILRAAAAITNYNKFVMVGTGAVIATASSVAAQLMMTNEIDIYVEGKDSEEVADLISATIGEGSMFHRTFRYYGDGVSPNTSIMSFDWKTRATIYTVAEGNVSALCPNIHDIAIAKLCAAREKDRTWLRSALSTGSIKLSVLQDLLEKMPKMAPDKQHLLNLLNELMPAKT